MKKDYRAKCPKCNGKGVIHIIPENKKHSEYFEPCKCQIKKIEKPKPKAHYNINPYALELKGK